MSETSGRNGETPIESWKEIGAYLQRDATTARRWEKEEGLPVHRHSHKSRSSVYAYPSEIDAWRASRKVIAEPTPAKSFWRIPAFAMTVLLCLITIGNGIRPVSAQQAGARGTLAKRLLCGAECTDGEADFSPDGRLMVLMDRDSGDIAIRDMSTGKIRRLLVKTGTWKDSEAYAETPVFSPDLRQIAYMWDMGRKEGKVQLRVVANETGAKPRVLVDNPENDYYEQPAWSPDGKSVLTIVDNNRNRTDQLARVSVSDGTVTVLKSQLSARGRPSFSPDGRYIVYDALASNPGATTPSATEPKNRHIYIMAADGSNETEIVKTAGVNESPVWTPDGKHILFISDRSGKFDLWSIAVKSGKVAGPESLLSPEIGDLAAIGIHGSSYYYYPIHQTEAEYVNIADFAPIGDGQSRVVRPTESFVGILPTWSPDGKSIGFKRHHPGSADRYDVVVHPLETGDERAYPTSLGTTGNGLGPVWSHDGKTVMTGFGTGGAASLYRIDLKTGEFKALPATAGRVALSPDNNTLYVARNDPKDGDKLPGHILAVDLRNGQERELFTMPVPGYVEPLLTPDGRTFVVRRVDQKTQTIHFDRLNVDGTGYREIYTIAQKDFRSNNFTLAQDGRWILLAKRNDDKNWELIRIPIEGGAPESTGVVLDATLYPRSLALSPDGSRIAFATMRRIREFRALDNVLSAVK